MQFKQGTYIYDQLMFGLLGLMQMVGDDDIAEALKEESVETAKTVLEPKIIQDYMDLFEFIFEDLFSTEDNMDRINEVYNNIGETNIQEFLSSYRYRTVNEQRDDYTNGRIEIIASSILGQDDPKSVIDICSGQGVFLTEAILEGVAKEYSGIEICRDSAIVSKIKILIFGMNLGNIKCGDLFNEDYISNNASKYDAVFCHMPMNMKLEKEALVQTGLFDDYNANRLAKRDSEWAFIKVMQRLTSEKGRSVALVRAGILFTEMGKKYRRELVESGKLEAVILLPANILNSTSVQTALIVLSSNKTSVKMIDASSYYSEGRRVNYITDSDIDMIYDLYYREGADIYYSDDENPRKEFKNVSYDVVADNDYSFEPKRYLLNGSAAFKNAVKLGDLTERIFRGTQIKADDHDTMMELYGDETNCYLLNLSDISSGFINDNLENVNVDDFTRLKKYMLQQGDVVISARGTKISVAVADNLEDRNIIATGNLIVIRCKESLDPYYLKAFFESESGKNLLKSVQTGSMIFAINPKQIKEIAIELLEIEKQKMIGEKAKWMVDELKESKRRIETITEKLSHLFDESKEV